MDRNDSFRLAGERRNSVKLIFRRAGGARCPLIDAIGSFKLSCSMLTIPRRFFGLKVKITFTVWCKKQKEYKVTARRTKFRSVFILAFVCSLLIPLAGCPGIFVPTGPFKHKSLYVTMSDNTKIAIETWVPSNSDPSKKYPTVMNITRYWKAIGAVKNNPVGVTNDDDSNQLAYKFVDQGYAYVTMDVRGTGGVVWGKQRTLGRRRSGGLSSGCQLDRFPILVQR